MVMSHNSRAMCKLSIWHHHQTNTMVGWLVRI